MKFFGDFFRGIGNCFKAFTVLFEKGLWPFMFIPLLMWIAMWVGSIYGFMSLAEWLGEKVNAYANAENIPVSGHWLSFFRPYLIGKLSFLISILLKVVFWLMSGTLIKYLLLMVLSPVLALLSEKADEKLTKKEFPFNFLQLIKDIFRGIVISLRNMILEYFFIFVFGLITMFIPILSIVTIPLLFLIGWYFVGFAMLDYNCERYKYSVSKSINFMKRNRGYACGIGFVYSFFMALPFFVGDVVGMFFGPALAIVGATISFLNVEQAEK